MPHPESAEARSVSFTRPHRTDYIATAEHRQSRLARAHRWQARGKLRVTVNPVYPLAQAAAAHRDLEAHRTQRKLLLSTAPKRP